MTRFRWFGFAAVVACALVALMGCGDSSAPAYDTNPTADYSAPSDYPAPGDENEPEWLEGIPEPPTPAEQIVLDEEQRELEENWVDAPSLPEDYPEPYTPGDYETEEQPCDQPGRGC